MGRKGKGFHSTVVAAHWYIQAHVRPVDEKKVDKMETIAKAKEKKMMDSKKSRAHSKDI
jgi:hypothetical protein